MPESTTTETPERAAFARPLWLCFVVLTALAYLVGLSFPFVGPDEPRYAQVAREMMERGDWITPTLGGHTWFEKPALLYWLEIISYKLFGVSETAARLGPAVFGLGTVIALFIIGRSLRKDRGCGVAKYFAIVGGSTLGLLVFAHGASFDIIVTFPITCALAAFWHHETGRKPAVSLTLFYFFVGVAVLAKGLIGIVFPFAIVGFYHLLVWRRPSIQLLISAFWGTVLAALVACIWYIPVYIENGWPFIDEFFIQHHFQRFTSNKFQHPQPFYFFFWVLPLMTLPWLPFFAKGLWRSASGISRTSLDEREDKTRRLTIFALSWILVPLFFFSLSGSKLPGYILPAVPGAAVLAAIAAHDLARRSAAWKAAAISVALLTVAVSLALALTLVPRYAADDSTKTLIDAADARGFGSSRVLMFNTISHNAEFYAAARLERDEKGQLIEHADPSEIAKAVQSSGEATALVLMPKDRAPLLSQSTALSVTPIADTKKLVIAAVALR